MIAALPITGVDSEAILSVSEKVWKVAVRNNGEEALQSVKVSPNRFGRNGRRVAGAIVPAEQ